MKNQSMLPNSTPLKIGQTMSKSIQKQGEFTGRHMAIIMVSFFGVIITVNLTMAIFANTTWTGLVVKNSYVASQEFNGVLQQSRKQAALGWRGEISGSGKTVTFELHKPDGSEVAIGKVGVMFRRPATEVLDHMVELSHQTNGIYSGAIDLGPGNWTAEVNAELTGQSQWKMIYKIQVEEDGSFKPVSNNNNPVK